MTKDADGPHSSDSTKAARIKERPRYTGQFRETLRSSLSTAEGTWNFLKRDNLQELPGFQIDREEKYSVQLIPDMQIVPGHFKPSPERERSFYAHPITIQALKKDIFVTDLDFNDLSLEIQCESCKQTLDLQFWHFCPYCGGQFPSDLGA